MSRPLLRAIGFGSGLATAFALSGARAQLALPGAIAPAPAGSVAAPMEGGKSRPRAAASGPVAPIAPKPPSEDTIVGHALYLDGTRSAIELQRQGEGLEVVRLALTGDRLSRSGEACRIEVVERLRLTMRSTQSGLRRYEVDFPACPFTFDALDGAILVSNDGKACVLKQADCRADPNGLWGMGENELDPKKAKDMLTLRARVEQKMRNDFKALYAKIKSDKASRKELVREQAGFSARREEICRAYVSEADFGYCALRVTEARALILASQLADSFKTAETGGKKKR
ncbi:MULTISPECIES: hypothetical protein [Methylosinus]|uniref:DUF1311 domain-containing protein n=1 Tax=Methylosinus trichosporium (strain ATCC 35070 / NCIMB 11131 / UNIQEM 75 / OB3b) TaxID=595536 RepID=A0A2D2D480_METT3|nr:MULTISPECIES: hypothetical protein [Methylosinus]ATQ69783.1 hypothetical protein CQW49_19260 [Methylosinus trichosporium OB3b]OBS52418.1 hypothetical protein A8B73_11205 [Methylosinus sp. 3S-1]